MSAKLTVLSVIKTTDLVNLGVGVPLLNREHVISTVSRFRIGSDRVEIDEIQSHLTDLCSKTGDFPHGYAAMHRTVWVPDVLGFNEIGVVGGDFDFFALFTSFRNCGRRSVNSFHVTSK